MKASVYCIVPNEILAEQIVAQLRNVGFSNNDISVLLPDKRGTMYFAHEHSTKPPEGATTGGVAGLGVGAAVGWLAGIGALAIPGLGPFIAAGPIMAALGGAAVGGTAGGIVGALVGMGIPEFEAKRYDAKVREGNILISVHTEDSKQRDAAKDVMDRAGAKDIATGREAGVSGKDKAA
jgi:hypothetical protein